MPELPEIETLVRELRQKISGFVFSKVNVSNETVLETSATELKKIIPGRCVKNVSRRGKYLSFDFENDYRLWFHLGMTGQLLLETGSSSDVPHTHLIFEFSGREEKVVFRDIRRFGCVFLADSKKEIPARIKRLGPEPMQVEPQQFAGLLKKRTGKIKSLLLNQTIVSGLGNIYTDESLYRAKVDPRKRPDRIPVQKLMHLHQAACDVLAEAISAGGSSIDDYRHSDGSYGKFQDSHRVYGREGRPCRDCGRKIRRTVISGRSSFFCQQCQK